jgi:hypothetical protein
MEVPLTIHPSRIFDLRSAVRGLASVLLVVALTILIAPGGEGNGGPYPAKPDTATGAAGGDSCAADTTDGSDAPYSDPIVAPVPFGPGEKLQFQVRVGLFGGVGKGNMEVAGIDTVRGRPTYHLRMTVRGGIPLAHVDDRLESWMDVVTLASRRFEQDQNEPKWTRHRIWEFYPEERRWTTMDSTQGGTLPTDVPLDDVSFLYYVRTLPLVVGETYTLDRYFRADGNPVIIKVIRTEKVKVPLGKFETIVVQPMIRTRGLFGQGGRAEVFFSNDARRIPVMLRSKIPVLGHLDLHLEKYTPGPPLSIAAPEVR